MTWLITAWKFRNEIAIAAIVLILISTGFYFKYVLEDRETLKRDIVKLKEELVAVQKQVTLNEDIANAIRKIKINSYNTIKVIEDSPAPPSNVSTVLVPSGVFRMYSSTVSTPNPTRNTATTSQRN
jgi:hypothetical protein